MLGNFSIEFALGNYGRSGATGIKGHAWVVGSCGGVGTYFSGAGHNALNLNPSRACTIASSRVMASTAPLLAVYAS